MKQSEHSLSIWAKGVSPSPTLQVDAKAKAMKAAGEDVCGFGAGEPDFGTPDFITQACITALNEGKTRYAPTPGIMPLREAIADKYTHEAKVCGGVKPSQVIVSPGGKFSCYLAVAAVCGPGDEVIIPAPYWVSYPEMVNLAGATSKVVFAGKDDGFKITPEKLKAAITDKTKLFIFNSPSNPTGVVYTKKEIQALLDVIIEADIYMLSDEIYEYLLYDGAEHYSPASYSEQAAARVLTVSGFSKSYAMTGWRIGTMVAPEPVAKAMSNIQAHMSSNVTTFGQWGALAALQYPDKSKASINQMLTAFSTRREFMFQALQGIDGLETVKSEGAFYLFPNISKFGLTSTEFASRLLEEEKVAVVPGIAFGADNYVRFSYATSDEVIKKGLERLKSFCSKL